MIALSEWVYVLAVRCSLPIPFSFSSRSYFISESETEIAVDSDIAV